jgi:hypothetical protein
MKKLRSNNFVSDEWTLVSTNSTNGPVVCMNAATTCRITLTHDSTSAENSASILWGDVWGDTWPAETISTFTANQWCHRELYHRTPADRMRDIIRGRKAPEAIIRQNDRRRPLPMPRDVRERRARETMRRVLGNTEYRRFLAHGFVSVRGKSGLIYQIFTGHGITCVFKDGQIIERLCVVLRGDFCPTDSLMMRYLMILNDEDQFRKLAIPHHVSISRHQMQPIDDRPLLEIFREINSGKEKVQRGRPAPRCTFCWHHAATSA